MMKGAQLCFFEIFTLAAVPSNCRATPACSLEADVLTVVEPYLFTLNAPALRFNTSQTTYTWKCQAAL